MYSTIVEINDLLLIYLLMGYFRWYNEEKSFNIDIDYLKAFHGATPPKAIEEIFEAFDWLLKAVKIYPWHEFSMAGRVVLKLAGVVELVDTRDLVQ